MQDWTATTRHEVTRKKSQKDKRLKHTGNLFRKNLQLKDVCENIRIKAIYIIGQRKAFYRQKILGSSCASKETTDIDILVTSGIGDRKIMKSIWIMSRPLSRIRKCNQLSQFR